MSATENARAHCTPGIRRVPGDSQVGNTKKYYPHEMCSVHDPIFRPQAAANLYVLPTSHARKERTQ